RTRAMNILIAAAAAKGDRQKMNTDNIAETKVPAPVPEEPKPPTKANARAQKPRVVFGKGKAEKKSASAKKSHKAPKTTKRAKSAATGREGSKTSKVLDLLKRSRGATLQELMKATGWQAHSVRGFLSGTVGKKMALAVTSAKGEDGERSYSTKG